ncbi:hypothetical protein [Streptomyces tanashiensis]|uniref:hypothetical protein n=1 Tax=Streptomyces tanashiensis TaxID=67367 RepID=UPI0033D65609
MGDTTAGPRVDFHLFTVPARRETEAAADVLGGLGVPFDPLQPPGTAPRAEAVLAGTTTSGTLAEAVAALRHRLRCGVAVRAAGRDEIVVRSDVRVEQGLIVVRGRSGDTPVRDAPGLRRAMDTVLAEWPASAPGPAPYARSILFGPSQNTALAVDAVRLARIFADPEFVRAADPTSDLLDNPHRVVELSVRPRVLLDQLLFAHALSGVDDGRTPAAEARPPGMEEAGRIAATVEVFVQSSTDPESRLLVRPLPDGGHGHVIGVAPRTSELMANLSWVMPTLLDVGGELGGDGRRERIWTDVDGSIASYLGPWGIGRNPAPGAPPRPLIPTSMPPGEVRHGPGDPFVVFDACALFVMARELVPLLHGALDEDRRTVRASPDTTGLSWDAGREAMVDSVAHVMTMNALVVGSGERGPHMADIGNVRRHFRWDPPSRFSPTREPEERARRDGILLLRSVERATEALLSYYAVAEMHAAFARASGDTVAARQSESVADRRQAGLAYAVRTKRRILPEAWGLQTWRDGEEERWERLQEYVRHVETELVPQIVAGRAGW